jgi:type VI protein secretion system component Hcp
MHTPTLEVDKHPPGELRSWRHHVLQPLTKDPRRTDPRVPGRSVHEDVVVTRLADHLTPVLLQACASGARFGEVWIRTVLEDMPSFDLQMIDVLVTGVLVSLEDGALVETVHLSYRGIRWISTFDGVTSERAWEAAG